MIRGKTGGGGGGRKKVRTGLLKEGRYLEMRKSRGTT